MIYFVILDYCNIIKNKINQKPQCHIIVMCIIVMCITLRAHHSKPNAPLRKRRKMRRNTKNVRDGIMVLRTRLVKESKKGVILGSLVRLVVKPILS